MNLPFQESVLKVHGRHGERAQPPSASHPEEKVQVRESGSGRQPAWACFCLGKACTWAWALLAPLGTTRSAPQAPLGVVEAHQCPGGSET